MTFSFTETYQVRHYECDVYGHVNNAVYIRYITETGLRAWLAAGVSQLEARKAPFCWRIKQMDIEYLQPLRYGDTVEVTVEPTGIQGTNFQQKYILRKFPGGEASAQAIVIAEHRDPDSGRPIPIPGSYLPAFFPDGLQPDILNYQAYPEPPDPPEEVFRHRQHIFLRDVDAQGMVDTAHLAPLIEENGRQVVAAHNWPMERMLEAGFAVLLRRSQIDYWQPARLDDEIEIATWASDFKRATAIRHYQVYRVSDGALLASTHGTGVWVNLRTNQPMRVPKDFFEDFRSNIVEG
jgi:acyl-CoA thioester hydrolase